MDPIFDAVSAWFLSAGIHPVLGAFVAGVMITYLLVLVLGTLHHSSPVTQPPAPGEVERRAALFELPDRPANPAEPTRISMTINHAPVKVPEVVIAHVRSGNTIEAIKALRAASGLGLKEAKDMVDMLVKSLPRA